MTINDAAAPERRTILVVEDHAGVRRMLRTMFEGEGYDVREAATEAQVLRHLSHDRISLITLDLGLSGEDGLAVARAVRARCNVPIIIITAKGHETERIVGLEVGADDYIAKPFNMREVLARVRAVLRRSGAGSMEASQTPGVRLRFAGYELRLSERTLRAPDESDIELTSREFLLLEILARRPNRILTREQLIDLIAGNDGDVLERSIDTLIGRLRRKIEPDPLHPSLIKTVRGGGYVFSATVKSAD